MVRLPICVGGRSQLVSEAFFKTGSQSRSSFQYHELHVCVCVCALVGYQHANVNLAYAELWWVLGVILYQSCNPFFKR